MHALDTLEANTKERPGTMFRDLSGVRLCDVGPASHKAMSRVEKSSPEDDAITFYLLNHAMALIDQQVDRDEYLGSYAQVVNNYHKALNTLGYRLFNYLLIITTRESRHISSSCNTSNKQTVIDKHGTVAWNFTNNEVVSNGHMAWFQNSLSLTLGHYLDYLVDLYKDLSWSSAYGGDNWGRVVEVLRDTVYGKLSIEMMLDVGYALAHNGGSIFDKGFLYNSYDGGELEKILDCQRAGVIPQLVKSEASKFVNHEHKGFLHQMEDLDLIAVNPWVNWTLVEMLGAEGSYPHLKNEVASKYGHFEEYKTEMAGLNEKVAAEEAAKVAAKVALEKYQFEVMPGVFIKKAEAVR